MGGQHHGPAALPPEETRYQLYRRLGGPQSPSGQVGKNSPSPGFDPRIIQLVASRYTAWAIPAPGYRTGVTGMWGLLGCHTVPNWYLIARNGNWRTGRSWGGRELCGLFVFVNINQLDALNFIISLFQASTCFEHTCSSSRGQNCSIQSLVSSHLQVWRYQMLYNTILTT